MAEDVISFSCAKCGCSDFNYPNDPPQDTDMISCAGCGIELGAYKEVQATTMQMAEEEMDKIFNDAFKGFG